MRRNCSQISPERAARLFDSRGKDDDMASGAQGGDGHCLGQHDALVLESLQRRNGKVPAHPQCGQGTQERRSSGQVELLESCSCLARAMSQQCWGTAGALPKHGGKQKAHLERSPVLDHLP